MTTSILDWIYPPTCMACRAILPLNNNFLRDLWICHQCINLFEPITGPICKTCGAPVETEIEKCASCYGKNLHFTSNRACFIYDEVIRDLMHNLKFRNKRYIAEGLGKIWANHVACYMSTITDAVLVPLPMHPDKQVERGFNQAEILSNALSKVSSIPTDNILERTEDTPPQSGLHPALRAENVQDAFVIRPNFHPERKNYILIDDIYTTGSSLNECAKTLKNSGINNVLCMTLCISVKNTPERLI